MNKLILIKTLFSLVIIFSLTACTNASRYRLDAKNIYMPMQWIEYDETSPFERNGNTLVKLALKVNPGLNDVFDIYGKPDYVRAANKQILNLAYLKKGQVLVFNLTTNQAPIVVDYRRFNQLSQQMLKLFIQNSQQQKIKPNKTYPQAT